MASRMRSVMANRMAKPMRSLWQNYAPNPNPNPNTSLAVSWGVSIKACINRYGSRGTGSASMHALREIDGGL